MKLFNPDFPLWGQAFRPMFLAAAGFSAFAMLLWGLSLSGMIRLPVDNPVFWHSHEMLFGFAMAVVAGFLLTAVQNWTGRRAVNGKPLLLLTLVWLSGRMAMLSSAFLPWWLIACIDMAFIPLVALFFWQLVFAVRQKRNYFFAPVLLLMLVCNGSMHWGNAHADGALVLWASHSVSWLMLVFITIIGGRILPMFTANGTMTPKVESLPWLEKSVLISTWLIAALYLTRLDSVLPGWVMSLMLVLSAVAHAVRIFRLNLRITLPVPLLWSLHLAYWFIPLGLLLLALHYAGAPWSFSTALHALTAGAIGGMIIAMIARVSLGHSGRPLQPARIMSVAFAMVLLAALLRSLVVALQPQAVSLFFALTSALWVMAFSIFVLVYWSVLISPRPDGRPG
ncbi:NnrS family protein [Thalassolituus marinus]|uniref:NnrS family protein n=1 Tax=Thalassolituus marinus TaxID=671053 RepID=A0ABS7ZQ53_9GAMM|nr:NnrS family protein [Thalassolituus marinus]MCA6063744.1 NnrS family protein [Thalassolituus marinus]